LVDDDDDDASAAISREDAIAKPNKFSWILGAFLDPWCR
jgi:hypothetical protein